MTANAARCKLNNQNSNNNGSAKLTCTKKVEKCDEKKNPPALPEVHPMVIVTVLPVPSN